MQVGSPHLAPRLPGRAGGRENHEPRNDEEPTHDEHGDADGPGEIFAALAVCGDVATER